MASNDLGIVGLGLAAAASYFFYSNRAGNDHTNVKTKENSLDGKTIAGRKKRKDREQIEKSESDEETIVVTETRTFNAHPVPEVTGASISKEDDEAGAEPLAATSPTSSRGVTLSEALGTGVDITPNNSKQEYAITNDLTTTTIAEGSAESISMIQSSNIETTTSRPASLAETIQQVTDEISATSVELVEERIEVVDETSNSDEEVLLEITKTIVEVVPVNDIANVDSLSDIEALTSEDVIDQTEVPVTTSAQAQDDSLSSFGISHPPVHEIEGHEKVVVCDRMPTDDTLTPEPEQERPSSEREIANIDDSKTRVQDDKVDLTARSESSDQGTTNNMSTHSRDIPHANMRHAFEDDVENVFNKSLDNPEPPKPETTDSFDDQGYQTETNTAPAIPSLEYEALSKSLSQDGVLLEQSSRVDHSSSLRTADISVIQEDVVGQEEEAKSDEQHTPDPATITKDQAVPGHISSPTLQRDIPISVEEPKTSVDRDVTNSLAAAGPFIYTADGFHTSPLNPQNMPSRPITPVVEDPPDTQEHQQPLVTEELSKTIFEATLTNESIDISNHHAERSGSVDNKTQQARTVSISTDNLPVYHAVDDGWQSSNLNPLNLPATSVPPVSTPVTLGSSPVMNNNDLNSTDDKQLSTAHSINQSSEESQGEQFSNPSLDYDTRIIPSSDHFHDSRINPKNMS